MISFWDGVSKLKIVFITVLVIVSQSMLSPAYNIPLYICGFFIWNISQSSRVHRTRLIYLLIYTFLLDFIWMLYLAFSNYWAKDANQYYDLNLEGQGEFITGYSMLIFCFVNFGIKIILVIMMINSKNERNRGSFVSSLKN